MQNKSNELPFLKNWVSSKYPLEKRIQAVHPETDHVESAWVCDHLIKPTYRLHAVWTYAIMVQFQDETLVEIACMFLQQNGRGERILEDNTEFMEVTL